MLVPRNNSKRQGGVALITVILLVALMTAIVSRLSLLSGIWMRQVENSSAMVQAGQATRAAQLWISDILENDKNNFDGQTDVWAQPVIPAPIAWGEMFGWIEDMQSRFNVNNLVDKNGKVVFAEVIRFEYLLETLGLDSAISGAVVDWIDPDGTVTGSNGAEDLYYMGLDSPYLAANRPLIDERELLQVRGMDQLTWNTLGLYITALPEKTKVNINTAKPEVIAAAIYNPETNNDYMQDAKRWADSVVLKPFASLEEVNAELAEYDGINLDSLDVSSSYFKANTQMLFGSVEHRMSTLYQRDSGRAQIIQQTRTLF